MQDNSWIRMRWFDAPRGEPFLSEDFEFSEFVHETRQEREQRNMERYAALGTDAHRMIPVPGAQSAEAILETINHHFSHLGYQSMSFPGGGDSLYVRQGAATVMISDRPHRKEIELRFLGGEPRRDLVRQIETIVDAHLKYGVR